MTGGFNTRRFKGHGGPQIIQYFKNRADISILSISDRAA
ncbi:hypothetical protein OH687_28730 [Burkholderia anthina]|nr:hypothetical protein OH687_28730 [Burkholderia anthina]